MSKKYVIEIKPEYEDSFNGLMVLGAKDSNLFVDTLAVEDLEELNSDYINEHYGSLQDDAYKRGINDGSLDVKQRVEGAYQQGLEDAWECAKKLFSTMSDTEIEKVFPVEWKSGFSGLMQMKPQYAMAKIKAYEEKQNDKIEVGDEVNWLGDCLIVTRIFQPHTQKEQCDGIDDDGCVYRDILMDDLEKTGRHFDIASILEEMKK